MDLKPANVRAGEGVILKDGLHALITGVRWSSTLHGDFATVVLIAEKDDEEEPVAVHIMDAKIEDSKDGLTKTLSLDKVKHSDEAVDIIQERFANCRAELQESINKTSTRSHSKIIDNRARANARTKRTKKVADKKTEFALKVIMEKYSCDEEKAQEILIENAKMVMEKE